MVMQMASDDDDSASAGEVDGMPSFFQDMQASHFGQPDFFAVDGGAMDMRIRDFVGTRAGNHAGNGAEDLFPGAVDNAVCGQEPFPSTMMSSAPTTIGSEDPFHLPLELEALLWTSTSTTTIADTAAPTAGNEPTLARSRSRTASGQSQRGALPMGSNVNNADKWRCPRPLCSKRYKNSNGLKYHLAKGNCEFDGGAPSAGEMGGLQSMGGGGPRMDFLHVAPSFPSTSRQTLPPRTTLPSYNPTTTATTHTDHHPVAPPPSGGAPFYVSAPSPSSANPAIRITHRRYWCKVPGCEKRYKNLNGLKYHGRVGHPGLDFKKEIKGVLIGGAEGLVVKDKVNKPKVVKDKRAKEKKDAGKKASKGEVAEAATAGTVVVRETGPGMQAAANVGGDMPVKVVVMDFMDIKSEIVDTVIKTEPGEAADLMRLMETAFSHAFCALKDSMRF
ncbi:Transcriptional regulator of ribosomal biogenesis proteins [Irineochytrium annulatum]|nr:Transcriptional regulator of ribosomal biogenesis proteins [Irineochytrium annulatum]